MANLAASDVTLTVRDRKIEGKRIFAWAQVAFGDAALTYPSGGVPLTLTKVVDTALSVEVLESNGSALKYEWDRSAGTIRIFYPTQETNSNASRAGKEFTAATTAPAATTLEVEIVGY